MAVFSRQCSRFLTTPDINSRCTEQHIWDCTYISREMNTSICSILLQPFSYNYKQSHIGECGTSTYPICGACYSTGNTSSCPSTPSVAGEPSTGRGPGPAPVGVSSSSSYSPSSGMTCSPGAVTPGITGKSAGGVFDSGDCR